MKQAHRRFGWSVRFLAGPLRPALPIVLPCCQNVAANCRRRSAGRGVQGT